MDFEGWDSSIDYWTDAPRLLPYPEKKGWMILVNTLGWVNSRLILGLVFFILLQPIAHIMLIRLTVYDPLRIRKKT